MVSLMLAIRMALDSCDVWVDKRKGSFGGLDAVEDDADSSEEDEDGPVEGVGDDEPHWETTP
jgi:hypothetical protein